MSYTQATVIIAAADQDAANTDFQLSFNAGLYEAIEGADPAVATNYVCAGLWTNSDLSKVTNDVLWSRKVYFGELQGILTSLNLKQIEVLPEQVPEQVPEQAV